MQLEWAKSDSGPRDEEATGTADTATPGDYSYNVAKRNST